MESAESAIPIINHRKNPNPNDEISNIVLLDRFDDMLILHKKRGVRVILHGEFENEQWKVHSAVPMPEAITPKRVLAVYPLSRAERRALEKQWLKNHPQYKHFR